MVLRDLTPATYYTLHCATLSRHNVMTPLTELVGTGADTGTGANATTSTATATATCTACCKHIYVDLQIRSVYEASTVSGAVAVSLSHAPRVAVTLDLQLLSDRPAGSSLGSNNVTWAVPALLPDKLDFRPGAGALGKRSLPLTTKVPATVHRIGSNPNPCSRLSASHSPAIPKANTFAVP